MTGGAGYIGSHAVLALRDAGETVVVLDDLSSGRRELVPAGVPLFVADIGDEASVGEILGRHRVEAVMHFAASASVPKSVARPLLYYRNNVAGTMALLAACVGAAVPAFIFSSSCAVYGNPERLPIVEDTDKAPVNPYGASKLACERMIEDACRAHGMRAAILRYFNVAGADPASRAGEWPQVPAHLLKIACRALAQGTPITVYGTDYPTPDGSCVRDYVHVSDIAAAHLAALQALRRGTPTFTVNCGLGRGYSVLEVLDLVQRASGRPLE